MHPRRDDATQYWLCAPALLLYGMLLATPLVMTVLLSFDRYSRTVGIIADFSFANYADILTDSYFYTIFLRSFSLALLVTLISALIGTPEAWILSRLGPRWRGVCLLVVLGPLLVSVVVRTLGWTILMGHDGIIAQVSAAIGGPDHLELLFSMSGMVIALTHVLVPFMVLAVWTALQNVDPATERAALSLGASQSRIFLRVILPQVVPGVLSGSLIVFSLAASAFATPALIGGRRLKVAATAIYDEFLVSLDWPLGSAIACVLFVAVMLIAVLWSRLLEGRQGAPS
jgi:putative spermidine/putrescine transport system permease protein